MCEIKTSLERLLVETDSPTLTQVSVTAQNAAKVTGEKIAAISEFCGGIRVEVEGRSQPVWVYG